MGTFQKMKVIYTQRKTEEGFCHDFLIPKMLPSCHKQQQVKDANAKKVPAGHAELLFWTVPGIQMVLASDSFVPILLHADT